MAKGGRFGKYGEGKRLERLRQKQRALFLLKPLRKTDRKNFSGSKKTRLVKK
ncbi:MAG TPA: hypothetical protein VEK32_15960 [Thermodesulfobacteriota bacterium]|nr:hypothetical protein [Thermodesulfobacteriota bacterium]